MGIINNLIVDYGNVYLSLIAVMYFGVKGFAAGFLKSIALPYFQLVHNVPLSTFHKLYIVAMIVPWCLKPLAGIMSDLVPIAGFRKRIYMIMAGSAGALATVGLTNLKLAIPTQMALFSVTSAAVMVTDLLMEASYSELLRAPGVRLSGNFIVSFVWILVLLGSIFGSVFAGVMADHHYISESIWPIMPFFTTLVVMSAVGYIPERRTFFSWAAVKARTGLVVVAAALSAVAVIGGYLLFVVSPTQQMVFMVVAAVFVVTLSFCVLNPTIASCNCFMFFVSALWIDFTGATAYFYTSECKGTPNFSYTFYTSYSMLLSSVFGIIGIFLFRLIRHHELRNIFVGVTIAQSVLATVEVAQATRLNLTLGISDEFFYLFGEAIIQPAVAMMMFMPMFILTSRCVGRPPILAAAPVSAPYIVSRFADWSRGGPRPLFTRFWPARRTLGPWCAGDRPPILFSATPDRPPAHTLQVSTSVGNYFIYRYNIGGCEFKELPVALLVGHVVLPLGLVPLAHLLVPKVKLD